MRSSGPFGNNERGRTRANKRQRRFLGMAYETPNFKQSYHNDWGLDWREWYRYETRLGCGRRSRLDFCLCRHRCCDCDRSLGRRHSRGWSLRHSGGSGCCYWCGGSSSRARSLRGACRHQAPHGVVDRGELINDPRFRLATRCCDVKTPHMLLLSKGRREWIFYLQRWSSRTHWQAAADSMLRDAPK